MTNIASETLFDVDPLIVDQFRIPSLLGKQMGEFMNTTRWVTLELVDETGVLFGSELDLDPPEYISPEYAKGTNFEDEFQSWLQMRADNAEYRGYLVGFPQIIATDDQSVINCAHIWFNNSDILGTIAVPLSNLKNMYVHSRLRTHLQIELDELGEGASPRFEVPIARDKKTQELYFRDATFDDIEAVLKDISDEEAIAVLGSLPLQLSVIKAKYVPDSQKATLLDS